MADRTVHAQSGEEFLVRYDKAGHWYVEYEPHRYRSARRVTITEAVDLAMDMWKEGGTVHPGRPGGSRFDFLVRKRCAQFDGNSDER